MKLSPKFRADNFIYPAEHKDIMTIQGVVQKRLKGKDLEKELEGLKDFEKANAILTLYAYAAYEEGYRKGLKSLEQENQKVSIKNRNKDKFKYSPEDGLKITQLVHKRMKSKKQRKYRSQYCTEHKIEDSEESFVLSLTIHSFFEAGYVAITLDTDNMFKEMHVDNPEKASQLSGLFDELFSEVLK